MLQGNFFRGISAEGHQQAPGNHAHLITSGLHPLRYYDEWSVTNNELRKQFMKCLVFVFLFECRILKKCCGALCV